MNTLYHGVWKGLVLTFLLMGVVIEFAVLDLIHHADSSVQDAVVDLRGQTANISVAAVRTLATTQQTVADLERPVSKILVRTDKAVARLDRIMDKAEQSAVDLNARQAAILEQENQFYISGLRVVNDSDQAVTRLNTTLTSINTLVLSSNELVLNPHWNSALAHVDTLLDNTGQAMGHLNGTTADVQAYVHRATQPSSLGKTILFRSLGIAAPFAGAYLGQIEK